VAFNASDGPRQIEVRYEAGKKPKALFGQPSEVEARDGKLKFVIPARSGVTLG